MSREVRGGVATRRWRCEMSGFMAVPRWTLNPVPGVEAVFAELLADVLRVDHVSADSHFFDDLGADSLGMAHFCARVRKRGDLPSVSMKDIYRHPTIRSLA